MLIAGQRQPPPLHPHLAVHHSLLHLFYPPPCRPAPMSIWTGQCNCLETRFCHLHVASSHFASFSGLTLLYLPARNEIIRGVDEKLTSLLHLPMALSDGCHSNHYATEKTRWVKDGFECGSLGSQPGYDRTDRPSKVLWRHSLRKSKKCHAVSAGFIQFSGEVASFCFIFFLRHTCTQEKARQVSVQV